MRVIIDTDIGTDVDDAWALAYLISLKRVEPLGVTITDGDTIARARIACKLLHLTGCDHIPVAVGRSTPAPKERIDYQFNWAEDFTANRPIELPASDFIIETVKKYPGEVTLITIGPLQNLADSLRKEPELGKYLKSIVMMSGCLFGTAGSESPYPDWNVAASIKDAQLVYNSGLPVTIVPLDSTSQVKLMDSERIRVQSRFSPMTIALEALYRLWIRDAYTRMTLHDQLTVAEAIYPGKFFHRKETLPLLIDDYGNTKIDSEKGKDVIVCLDPKRDEFMEHYLSVITNQ